MYILNNLLTPFKIQPTQAHLLDWSQLAHESVGKFLTIAFTSLIYLAIWTIGKKFINKYLIQNPHFQQRVSSRKKTFSQLLVNIFQYTLLFFYIYGILNILGLPVGTLIASAGVVSLALGMGAQGFVSDLVNGITILSESQYDVGDLVKISGFTGTVISLGIRITKLRASDGTIIYIPNRSISIVENLTRGGIGVDISLHLDANNDFAIITKSINDANEILRPKFSRKLKKDPSIFGIVSQYKNGFTYNIHFQVVPGYQVEIKNAYFSEYIKQLQANKVIFN
ncbi:mechanosensitive ion channel family protein [Lactobacillus iners]|uniref:mechanosensitive ion channel family protein n=1 Tax=Lactobacillus iners TaxID=147802 RepID=UPI00254B1B3C|nr:mechanosensitive ion channel domain-containing protein [Lactobacillus iners]MDK6197728.1 mechanosensitive ion channel [Lactobacillus iners]MDK8134956.1 mechanosensitive ion channel [Lactobacillus iners]